jgi:plasmid stability protein
MGRDGTLDIMTSDIRIHDVMSGKQITIRNVTPEIASRLKALAGTRGESVNSTVLYILGQALGISERRERLERYATWEEADRRQLDEAIRAQRTIDDRLWR